MIKVNFSAWKSNRYVSLTEILIIIGKYFLEAKWYVNINEASLEVGADILENIDKNQELNIFKLLDLVTPDIQIVDGQIEAFLGKTREPDLIIRAVDSTSWDIETNNLLVINELKKQNINLLPFD